MLYTVFPNQPADVLTSLHEACESDPLCVLTQLCHVLGLPVILELNFPFTASVHKLLPRRHFPRLAERSVPTIVTTALTKLQKLLDPVVQGQ